MEPGTWELALYEKNAAEGGTWYENKWVHYLHLNRVFEMTASADTNYLDIQVRFYPLLTHIYKQLVDSIWKSKVVLVM